MTLFIVDCTVSPYPKNLCQVLTLAIWIRQSIIHRFIYDRSTIRFSCGHFWNVGAVILNLVLTLHLGPLYLVLLVLVCIFCSILHICIFSYCPHCENHSIHDPLTKKILTSTNSSHQTRINTNKSMVHKHTIVEYVQFSYLLTKLSL